jgi:CDP-diacylglycerol---serine O-phosphatidyltransferase
MGSKRHIPNLVTTLNLLFGCIAIALAGRGNLTGASAMIGASLVMDFLDGFSARALNAYSDIGKQLDSLSDMVSFGLAPAMILHYMMLQSFPLVDMIGTPFFMITSYIPFFITIFSALRLAKFNIDDDQVDTFKGLPTPASAIFIISLPLIMSTDSLFMASYLLNSYVLAGISILISALLVSNIRLFALKFKTFDFKANQPQYILVGGSVILLAILNVTAIPFIIVLYLILSFLFRDKF